MYNILIVGVGGQGTLLASRVLGSYAAIEGLDCKLSEVHGMAQRGGSVVTHVRMGDKVLSPIVAEGDADIILAFEKLEALRARHYLKKGGVLIMNAQEIYPMPVITGAKKYPGNAEQILTDEGVNLITINAADIAAECGGVKAANTVMIGALAKNIGFNYETIKKALECTVPHKFLEMNIAALQKGYNN